MEEVSALNMAVPCVFCSLRFVSFKRLVGEIVDLEVEEGDGDLGRKSVDFWILKRRMEIWSGKKRMDV